MTKREKTGQAKTNFLMGNYSSAILLYKELIADGNSSFVEKIGFNEKIKFATNFLAEVTYNNIGEAFFPAVNSYFNNGAVYSIVISDGEVDEKMRTKFIQNWEVAKNEVIELLDKFIVQNKIPITVFDWKFENYYPSIKTIPSSPSKPLENEIDGTSYQLAMAIALLSKILNKKVDDKFAFSGTLITNGNSIEIGKVEGIEQKSEVIKQERPNVTQFVNNENETDLLALVNNIFGVDFFELLKENIINNDESENIRLVDKTETDAEWNNSTTKATLLEFNHSRNISTHSIKKMNKYFDNIAEMENSGSVIIDGIKPNFATGMIIPKYKNRFNGFIAVANPQFGDRKAAIVYKSDVFNNAEIGEIISYS